ncbi:NUDIX domain-containing protein [Streptomyces sp. B6B3]|uniref:NUDIX hydrolase n=1 Tax=Streptomyces sp. B6B3 TaxID=3153570 RepID=UPI00325C96C0
MVTRRRTSRLLMLDEDDRLLLLCGRDPRAPGARWWFTVGGGVEAGEDYVTAALREVREETGLRLPAHRLGPVVWTREALFTVDGHRFDQYEEYRPVRVLPEEAAAMRFEQVEACHGHRWWSRGALATTAETVRPRGVGQLLNDLLSVGPASGAGPRFLGRFDEDAEPDVTPPPGYASSRPGGR